MGAARSLQLVLLSGCLTARTGDANPYGGTAQALLRRGIPAVIAMQYSIFEHSAMTLWGLFYAALAAGKPVEEALAEGRRALSLTGQDNVAWAIPTLSLRSSAACQLIAAGPRPAPTGAAHAARSIVRESFGELERMTSGFVGRHKEIRQIRRELLRSQTRAVLVHGFGGLGKTVLATKIAAKLQQSDAFDGFLGIRVRPDMKAEQVLNEFNSFLTRNGVEAFAPILQSDAPLTQKVQALGQLLRQIRLLVIFDNVEDWLRIPDAQPASATDPNAPTLPSEPPSCRIADPDIANLLSQLVNTVSEGSKFLITSRYEFDILPRGRGRGAILRVPLGELSRVEAIRLMGRLSPLAACDRDTRRQIYEGVGGHPFTLNLFAERAADVEVDYVLADIRNVRKEAIRDFLLEQIYTRNLSAQARTLLCCMSILRRAAPKDCLDALLGTHRIEPAIDALLRWGMMVRVRVHDEVSDAEEDRYQMHALVREFGQEKLGASRRDVLLNAAKFYEERTKQQQYGNVQVFTLVEAQRYYAEAGEYERAADIVNGVQEYLARWGFREMAIALLRQSVETTAGKSQAYAKGNLASRLHEQGDLGEADGLYKQSLQIAKELGDERGIAISLHQMAILQHSQGNLDEATRLYEQSLQIKKELGNKRGIASTVGQMGRLLQKQGQWRAALRNYVTAWRLFHELQSPYSALAQQCIQAVRQQVGEETFQAWMTADSDS